ncbi:M28 family peptidase [Corallococcus sp. bb12-1]|uniref:M28 family peptidase n=1 Tax=Corallococcus sp. bb12-1 TaxID=2996784 RepID=UPI0022707F1B|nr:M28 family peptidase [Corallococcus sp. bb12-1]MCY1042278.1 M28 family peptidase [Corallococcus sp. bb12-1]
MSARRGASVFAVRAGRGAGVFAVLVTVLGAAWVARCPVEPRPAGVAPEVFSEARALPLVRALAEEPRPLGSPAAQRAVALLVERLRALPGVEVVVQDAEASVVDEGSLILFRTVNVLARLPGESADAVLVSAHYDSPEESPGAGDNALAVAAAVEVLRALSAGPRPRHTVLLNLNGGEEDGRLGAAGFLRHPWARDVKAFINLEGVGVGGRLVLFRASPGAQGLLEAYADAVPSPSASVLGQDVMASGAAPFYTDFEQYVGGGIPGLDLALVEGGYAYHTSLDRPEAVPPGTLQHVGDTVLALVRRLAAGPLPPQASGAGTVTFFDVLGVGTVVYPPRIAVGLAVGAALLFLGACEASRRRGLLSMRGLGRGFVWMGVGGVLGALLPLAGAVLVGFVLGRPQGWYGTPALGLVTYGALAVAGVFAGEAAWAAFAARRGAAADSRHFERWGGALAWGICFTVLGTAAGVGVTYPLLVWALGGAGALLVAARRPRWSGVALALGFLPGLCLMAQAASRLLLLALPLTGHLLVPFPLDGAIALLVALPLLAGAWLVPAALPWAEGGRLAGLSVGGLALGGWVALALVAPHDAEHPRRLHAVERTNASGSVLILQSMDGLALGTLVPGLTEAQSEQAQTERSLPWNAVVPQVSGQEPGATGSAHPVPASASPEPTGQPALTELTAPRLTVERVEHHGAERQVSLLLTAQEGASLRLEVPREVLVSWSLSPELPALPADAVAFTALALNPPRGEWRVELRLRSTPALPVRLRASREGAVTPTLDALRRSLGPLRTGSFFASHTVEARP